MSESEPLLPYFTLVLPTAFAALCALKLKSSGPRLNPVYTTSAHTVPRTRACTYERNTSVSHMPHTVAFSGLAGGARIPAPTVGPRLVDFTAIDVKYQRRPREALEEYLALVPKDNSGWSAFMTGLILEKHIGRGNRRVEDYFSRALPLLRNGVESGNPRAMYGLGRMYKDGCLVPQDLSEATRLHRLGAELGFPWCQHDLADIMVTKAQKEGRALEDVEEVIQLLESASSQGVVAARVSLAHYRHSGIGGMKNEADASRIWKELVEDGYLCRLGEMFISGDCVPKDVQRGKSYLEEAAEAGDENALYNLGLLYHHGDSGVDVDMQKAVYYYTRAGQKNHVDALNELGHLYMQGDEVEPDSERACGYFSRAAEIGSPSALASLGMVHYKGLSGTTDMNKAVKYFELSAKKGDPRGQYYLGFMCEVGDVIPKNLKRATRLYKLAADQGHFLAQLGLGIMKVTGNLNPEEILDMQEAIRILTQGAESGVDRALFTLGTCYLEGIGVPKNFNFGVALLKQAAELDLAPALNKLGFLYSTGREDLPSDKEKSVEFLRKAADLGSSTAKINLAITYADGDGIPEDTTEAMNLLREVLDAEPSHPVALIQLAAHYARGHGVPTDMQEAVRLYTIGVDHGHHAALRQLGMCYISGSGVARDDEKGLQMLRIAATGDDKAPYLLARVYEEGWCGLPRNVEAARNLLVLGASRGCREATFHLGRFYEDGVGVPVDQQEATRHYRKAAERGFVEAFHKLNRKIE